MSFCPDEQKREEITQKPPDHRVESMNFKACCRQKEFKLVKPLPQGLLRRIRGIFCASSHCWIYHDNKNTTVKVGGTRVCADCHRQEICVDLTPHAAIHITHKKYHALVNKGLLAPIIIEDNMEGEKGDLTICVDQKSP